MKRFIMAHPKVHHWLYAI